MIGSRIGDRYEILGELGQGNFGIVYRARDHRLQREVALKLMTALEKDSGPRPDLSREAELTAGLNHPGVMTVFDTGTHGKSIYLVSEIINGTTLEEALSEEIPSPAQAVIWFLEIAKIMTYAHEKGVIHRDLSLANITLVGGSDGTLKIMDFGLGGQVDQEDDWTSGLQIGTPATMAPEQITGATTGPATDIYSFGAGLYRLLTGKPPFMADHSAALEYSICNEDPAVLPSSLPADLNKLVMRCLMKDPKDRPESFEEVADILGGLDLATTTGNTGVGGGKAGIVQNPFLNRAMIQNPEDFYGRKREIRKMYARIDAVNPQCVSMVGDRRIGKSSLLAYVANESNRARYMVHAAETDFVFMDFQSDFDFDQTRFLQRLFEQLSIFGGVSRQAEPSFPELERALERRSAKGRRLVILMDEFERITANPKFERWFFSSLRSAANHYKVAYVTSSEAELQQMCHTRDISDSPFFNIFSNLLIGPLQKAEAEQLIREASKATDHPLADFCDQLISLAGLFPIYLQIACSCLFDQRIDNPDDTPDWDFVKKSFFEEATPHFDFTWSRLQDSRKEILLLVAAGQVIPREQAHLNDSLLASGLLVRDGNGLKIFGTAFREFVMRHETSSRKGSFMKRLFGRNR